jgi:hypothetical protein
MAGSSIMTAQRPDDTVVPETEAATPEVSVETSTEPRNQYGRTWEEHRKILLDHLRPTMTDEQLARELAIQERQFEIFSGFVATEDGRQAQLQRSFDATPPERRARILEAARKSWK